MGFYEPLRTEYWVERTASYLPETVVQEPLRFG